MEKQTPTDAPRPAPAAPALLTEGEIEDWFASETSTLHPSDDFEGPRLKLITSLRDMAQAYRRSQQGDCAMVPAKPVAWRWRYSQEHQWHYVEQEHQRSSQAYEWEPVFAAHKDTK